MQERVTQELDLLRQRHPGMEFREEPQGVWVRIPGYSLPDGWDRKTTDVVFLVPPGYPGTALYGIYTPEGLTYQGGPPANCSTPSVQPPFAGRWNILSWSPDGGWRATASLTGSCTLVNWVNGFAERFRQGK